LQHQHNYSQRAAHADIEIIAKIVDDNHDVRNHMLAQRSKRGIPGTTLVVKPSSQ
jgi:hypothetical protein